MAKRDGTLIKVCGITRGEDAEAAIACGVDAIGLNFYPKSPRFIPPDQAKTIAEAVAARVHRVGLFVNATTAEVRAVLERVPLDILQFHGDEAAAFCSGFGKPWWKALPMKAGTDLAALAAPYAGADGLLVDTWSPVLHGGTGKTFDWALLDQLGDRDRLILAGGLNPGNVAGAVTQVRPFAVDTSSGVESSPGVKDPALMRQFVEAVRSAS